MKFFSNLLLFCVWLFSRVVPFRQRSSMGSTLGALFYLIKTKDRRIAELQLTLAGFDPMLSKKVYQHVGQVLFESVNSTPIIAKHDKHFQAPAWHMAEELIKKQRGLIVLTGHFGHWDLLAAYSAARKIPLLAVGREAQSKLLQPTLRWLRSQAGVNTMWRGGSSGVQTIKEALAQGSVVAALIDQDTRVRSIPIPFFGHPAATPITLARLARETNTPVVSAFCTRISPLTYEISIREISIDTDEQTMLSEFHHHLEDCIRAHPDQWVWFHKRWRTMADGKRLSSREYLAWLIKKTS